ncbi:2-hydroxyhepta-2,4-diene-1,7-dioate isomerase [Planctomycetota bacterium]|nr:2-hydroxyhepta-2,4-diene-1,7-dioate isomerase [Planctomycetota bacterium]
MNITRFGARGSERPAIITPDGQRRDCSSLVRDWDGASLANQAVEGLRAMPAERLLALPPVPPEERWASCVARPGKVVCVGLNYADHAAEAKLPVPSEPILFMKATTAVCGPYDDVQMPPAATKLDWEVELGVIIGQEARHLSSLAAATACIAGYCVVHDVSERAFQIERGGQWTKGKSCDTFCPVGPWCRSADAMPDVQALDMRLSVNGIRRQNGSTRTMIFPPAFLVQYISGFMTLEPGDLISTGTPPGVAMGMAVPQWLQRGDVVELEIDGLGRQCQRIA